MDWKAKHRRQERVTMASIATFWLPWIAMFVVGVAHGPLPSIAAPLIAVALVGPLVVWFGGNWLIRD